MRIAVTGANGFIGRHVMSHFAAGGHAVSAVARPFAPDTLARVLHGADVVVHLAGVVTAPHDRDYFDGNVTSTRIVAEATRDAGARLVHVSSLAAAGPAPAGAPRGETDPVAPITTYGRTKLEGELAVKAATGLRWTILRPGVVYGPGDRALVPLFRMARSGVMPLVGRAGAAYTFVHISDMVRAVAAAVDRSLSAATVFVGHPDPVTPRELIERVRDAAGKRGVIVPIPQALLRVAAVVGDLVTAVSGRQPVIDSRRFAELNSPGFVCRVDRLRNDLGVEARIGIAEGIRGAADRYLSQA